MKKCNKVLFPIVASSFVLLSSCGGAETVENSSNAENSSSVENSSNAGDESDSAEIKKIVMSFGVATIPTPEAEVAVENAINEITSEKIGVEVDLQLMDFSSYMQQIPLMLSAGEQVDLFNTVGMNFLSLYNSGYLLNMDENDLFEMYGQGIRDVMGDYADGGRINGELYGFVSQRELAAQMSLVVAKEYLDGIGYEYNPGEDNTISDDEIEVLLAKLHEAYPDKTVIAASGMHGAQLFVDYVGGDGFGVLLDPENSLELSNLYSSDNYMNYLKKVRNWNQLGYIAPDALTDTNMPTALVGAGSAMAYEATFKPGLAKQETETAGREMVVFIRENPYVLTSDYGTTMDWVISSGTESKEASMKFLNELYSNPELARLINYGIEGIDYIVNDNGFLEITEDLSPEYAVNVAWELPGQFIAGVWEGQDVGIWDSYKALNDEAVKSIATGFVFDQSNVSSEYTALYNIYKEYQKQLECGFLDPEAGVAEMLDRMEKSGLDKYIAEKQSQLDAWAVEVGLN